jgi:hypothetical protein
MAGKDVLIKVVAQVVPTYAMSCFDLTKTLYDDIGMMIACFWWSQQDKENKLHWISWEKMCSRKEKGGLGYRALHLFNLAMLSRQGWQLLTKPESLCAQVLRAKYYPDGAPKLRRKTRHFLLLEEYSTMPQSCQRRLYLESGDGTQIKIWEDPWLLRGFTRMPITPRGVTILHKVSDLIDPYTGTSDKELIHDIFWEEDVKYILAIPIKHGEYDTLAWNFDTKGLFSVKSAYHVLEDNRQYEQVKQHGTSSSSVTTHESIKWLNLRNSKL